VIGCPLNNSSLQEEKLFRKEMNFSLSINCIDWYESASSVYDPKVGSNTVPIIRIFGKSRSGEQVLGHVHGAFPYLFVEYEGNLSPDEGM